MASAAMAVSEVNPDDFLRIERLFQGAADRSPEERGSWLDEECTDPEERNRVQRLLDRFVETLDTPGAARHVGPFPAAAITEGPGSVIGRYKLLQTIGEGGFGVVYMAEQQEPVVRKVALKIIKLGMDTREVVARFEAERQALALMDHPHIAKVLDGGATDSGRPYFVMELVRGVSVTEFCDGNNLGPKDRLQLFRQICQAVQHAHQKGVIHRDLKPSNVLVTLADGTPMPKIIDFGIAKAMHTRLTEKTLFTRYEQFVGTPAYMSPEQAELSALDVDTRTDIYSLGVLLYELLTGTTPFDTRTLEEAGLFEIQRVIREVEPPRPSVRVSTTGDAHAAQLRGVDVAGLGRILRGDLDWIVMKALEKDRSRRYDTAGELAEDIRRHLSSEPVSAGPPRASYRLRKFLNRHRVPVVAGALVTLVLVVGMITTTAAMFRATDSAERARQQAERALTAVDFLLSTLSLTNPEVALDPDVSVMTLLDHTSRRVEAVFAEDPGVEVRVRNTIGRAYFRLGQYQLAEPHLRRVVEIVDDHLEDDGTFDTTLQAAGFDEMEYYQSLWTLTNICFNLQLPDSFVLANKALVSGLDYMSLWHPVVAENVLRFERAVQARAWTLEEEAMEGISELFEEAFLAAETALPPGDPKWPIVIDAFLAAGYTVWYTPHEPIAESFWGRALEIQRRELPATHPEISVTVNLLVGLLNKQGRLEESETLLRESLDALRRVHREGSYPIAAAEGMLGQTLTLQKRFDEAESALLTSDETIAATLKDPSNWIVLESTARIIELYQAWDREESAAPYRQAMARAGARSPYAIQWVSVRHAFSPTLAPVLAAADRFEELCGGYTFSATPGEKEVENVAAAVDALVAALASLPPEGDLAVCLARLFLPWSNGLDLRGQGESRFALVSAAWRVLVPRRDTLILDAAEAASALAECARERGQAHEAREYALEAWRTVGPTPPTGQWYVGSALVRIARGIRAEGLREPAEKILLRAHEILDGQLGSGHPDTREVRGQLRQLYDDWGRPEESVRFADPPPSSTDSN